MPLFDEMICLVGENPMPIYLGIADLCAEGAEVWLVHSRETRRQAIAVQKKLGKRWKCPAGNLVTVDAYSPSNVLTCLAPLMAEHPGAVLNYTGGTKIMSAFAVQAHCAAVTDDMRLGRLCYLEDREHLFRFGDGEELRVSGRTRLDVRELIELHGGSQSDTGQWPPVSTGDLLRMWDWHRANKLRKVISLAGNLERPYEKLSMQWDQPSDKWKEDSDWLAFLRLFTRGDANHPWWDVRLPSSAGIFEEWDKGIYSDLALQWRFATGVWLELLVGYCIHCALDRITPVFDDRPVDLGGRLVPGAQVRWNNQPFETDLLLGEQNRLRLVSVTIQMKQDRLKAKMFEAQVRARQIGGGQAFAAVVSPARAYSDRGVWVDPITDCRQAIDPAGKHRFFGGADIEQWIQGRGLDELRSYLDA